MVEIFQVPHPQVQEHTQDRYMLASSHQDRYMLASSHAKGRTIPRYNRSARLWINHRNAYYAPEIVLGRRPTHPASPAHRLCSHAVEPGKR